MKSWRKLMMRNLLLLALALTMVGCGGSDGNSYTPQWTHSDPIQGGQNFNPASIITYTFDEAPGGTPSIVLRTAAGVNVPGVTGTGRQSRSITFKPDATLELDTDYVSTLTISGGKVSGPFVINFRTAATAKPVMTAPKTSLPGSLEAETAARTGMSSSFSPAGEWKVTEYHAGDSIELRIVAAAGHAPEKADRVLFSDAGLDGTWNTPDDTAIGWQEAVTRITPGLLRQVEHHAGADGMAFTGDDVMAGYRLTLLNSDGSKVQTGWYVSAGADQRWFTADDELGAKQITE